MTKRCLNCKYHVGQIVGTSYCDYLSATGTRRPCEGDSETHNCEAFERMKRRKKSAESWKAVID